MLTNGSTCSILVTTFYFKFKLGPETRLILLIISIYMTYYWICILVSPQSFHNLLVHVSPTSVTTYAAIGYVTPRGVMYYANIAKRRGSRQPCLKHCCVCLSNFLVAEKKEETSRKSPRRQAGAKQQKLHLDLEKTILQFLRKHNLRLLLKHWQMHGPR